MTHKNTAILQTDGRIRLFGGVAVDFSVIGRRIQEARISKGITQAELAQQCEVSTKHISALETGGRSPKLETFIQIANALDCDPNRLLIDVIDCDGREDYEEFRDKFSLLPAAEQRRLIKILDVFLEDSGK